jgi:hypothetical protein
LDVAGYRNADAHSLDAGLPLYDVEHFLFPPRCLAVIVVLFLVQTEVAC